MDVDLSSMAPVLPFGQILVHLQAESVDPGIHLDPVQIPRARLVQQPEHRLVQQSERHPVHPSPLPTHSLPARSSPPLEL